MKSKNMAYSLFAIFLITIVIVLTCGKKDEATSVQFPPAHMDGVKEVVKEVETKVEEVKEVIDIIKEKLPVLEIPAVETPVEVEAPVVVPEIVPEVIPEVIPEVTPEPAPEEENDGVIEEEESNANE